MKQCGFIQPTITEQNWILGSALGAQRLVINPSGKWKQYQPKGERQSFLIETQNCTSFGTFAAIEALEKFLTGNNEEHSDRALGIAANPDPYGGNDPTKVADTIRHKTCVVPEDILPFPQTETDPAKYFTPKPLPTSILQEGQKWADRWELQYEIVFTGGTPEQKKAKLKEALTKGTVSISVSAWYNNANFYYKPVGSQDNHWVWLEEYDVNDCPVIFDSYGDNQGDPFEKTLESLYDFGIAIVFYLVP